VLAGNPGRDRPGRFADSQASQIHQRAPDDSYTAAVLTKVIDKGRSDGRSNLRFLSPPSGRVIPILLLEACFHLAGVCEIYVTLSFISQDQAPTFLTALFSSQ